MERPRCMICDRVLTIREALSGQLCSNCVEEDPMEDQAEEPETPAWSKLFDLQGRKSPSPGMAVFYQNNY